MHAKVIDLVRYPVKSCAGESLSASAVGPMGLDGDRLFMIVDGNNKFMTQRTHAQLAVIRPQLRESTLALSAPGMPAAEFGILFDGERLEVLLHKWTGKAVDQGAGPAEWISRYMGEPCRLVRVLPEHERHSNGVTGGNVGFADADAVHVTSLSSLDNLNSLILQSGGTQALPMNRFRPNIVLSGWDVPHTEDRVQRMTIGAIELSFEKRAIRCVIPTVDQETGQRAGHEPTKTLATYRREPDGVSFGTKYAVTTPGTITLGDPATVLTWHP